MHIVQAGQETDGALRITVNRIPRLGGMLAAREFVVTAGQAYSLTVNLSAESRTKVSVGLRERKPPYRTGGVALVDVQRERQEITVVGGLGFDAEVLLYVQLQEPGTVWVHEATIRTITESEINDRTVFPAVNGILEPNAFGLHINKLGRHNTWPALNIGMIRLWDTGTTWADLEPVPHATNKRSWGEKGQPGARLRYYLRHVEKHSPETAVMLTLAASPMWAAGPVGKKYYAGSSSPPRDLTDWRTFIRNLVRKVGNRIAYYELWNEADLSYQYSGDSRTLIGMAEIMAEEIRDLGASGQVSSPNITTYGTRTLARFLSEGGGAHVDFISWHHYPSHRPEYSVPAILGIRDVMNRYGADALPLFNTEGRIGGGKKGSLEHEIPFDLHPGLVARAYLVQFAFGVRSFSWYMWDDDPKVSPVILNGAGPPTYDGLSPSGTALRTLISWIVGRQVINRKISNIGTERAIWRLDLETAGRERSSVLWSVEHSKQVTLPTSFGYSNFQRLDGTVVPLRGNDVRIGPDPILVY